MANSKANNIEETLHNLKSSNKGLTNTEANARLKKYGSNEITVKKESRLKKLLGTFWGPIPWLIEIAAILSASIAHWADFAIIMCLLIVNALVEFIQSTKASNALEALKSSMALQALTMRDGKWQTIPAKNLVPGDIIHLENGNIIPADCVLLSGEYLSVDQSALTGESMPVNKQTGDLTYSGSITKQGNMTAVVTKTGGHTYFGKTAHLVATAGNVSHFQQSVIRIGQFLIIGALLFALLILAKTLYTHDNPMRIIELVLVLVIASIPVAMPTVLSVTMALGALVLSKEKAIVSKLQAIEELAAVNVLCSDKTGTLTQNKLTFGKPYFYKAKTLDELLLMGALASSQTGKDPIDNSICAHADAKALSAYKQKQFMPFDPVHKRTAALIKQGGKQFYVTKGAPQVIIDLCDDDKTIKDQAVKEVNDLATHGFRALAIAVGDANQKNYHLLGILSMYDAPRTDSKKVIEQTKHYGIEVKMVTGDDLPIAEEIASELGMGSDFVLPNQVFLKDENMDHLSDKTIDIIAHANGFARVFPEHKYGIVKALQARNDIVAMTGDGVNDAPALKQADVGIAVSGATDAARSAADLILTLPGLSVIITALLESRKIFSRMINYVNYRVAMSINIMLFITLAILLTNVQPLTPIMIVMLALLDDLPMIAIAYDNTRPTKKPVKWDLSRVLTVASVLGVLSVAQNFGLMALVNNYFSIPLSAMQTVMFLQLVVAGHLLLFISRHRKLFFTRPFPAIKLIIAIAATQILAVIICKTDFLIPAISWQLIGFVWGYAIIWMFALNIIRMLTEQIITFASDRYLSDWDRSIYDIT